MSFVNNGNVLFMNDFFLGFMDNWNVFLVNCGFMNHWLYMFMDNISVMLVDDILMCLFDNVLMMFMNYIFPLLSD